MPTFAISYLSGVEARREAAYDLVPVVEEIVPATMNDLYEITGDKAFNPDDVAVDVFASNRQPRTATDLRVLGAIPPEAAGKDIWAGRSELRARLYGQIGFWIVENVKSLEVSTLEVELIPQPSCGQAGDIRSGEGFASWGGPADLKQ